MKIYIDVNGSSERRRFMGNVNNMPIPVKGGHIIKDGFAYLVTSHPTINLDEGIIVVWVEVAMKSEALMLILAFDKHLNEESGYSSLSDLVTHHSAMDDDFAENLFKEFCNKTRSYYQVTPQDLVLLRKVGLNIECFN
jgi:hypothetical protein